MKFSKYQLESRVADLFGYSNAIFFGRARSGVAALLTVLGLSPDTAFIMPSNLCSSLLLAVHSSGVKIELVGVSESNGLPSDLALVDAMKRTALPGLIMPTHLYGFVQPCSQTLAYARANNWFVLENDTLATRACLGGASRTAFGDALLVSFGYAKTIEAGGGGALLTNDRSLARELQKQADSFILLDDRAQQAENDFMLLDRYLRNTPFEESGISFNDREKLLFTRAPNFKFSFPENLLEPLSLAIDGLSIKVDEKRRRIEMWNHFLSPFDDVLLRPDIDYMVPWRLIRRVPGIRDKVVYALRQVKIDAGTNFPPLTTSFPSLFQNQLNAAADQWGLEVLNLWLSSDYGAEQMLQTAEVIERVLLDSL
jgi:dTDP-4-amino-4,6-dideoxygalactose transaminase